MLQCAIVFCSNCNIGDMRWLRLVGSLKLLASFVKEPYKRDYILQKRPINLRGLLIAATPYLYKNFTVCCSVLQCVAVCYIVYCSVLPCVAACCSVLQCAVVQYASGAEHDCKVGDTYICVAACCSVLQCIVV